MNQSKIFFLPHHRNYPRRLRPFLLLSLGSPLIFFQQIENFTPWFSICGRVGIFHKFYARRIKNPVGKYFFIIHFTRTFL